MRRRSFVSSLAATAVAGLPSVTTAADKRLPIRKGIILQMLPAGMPMEQRFQIAAQCGFQSMECLTEDDPKVAEQIRAASVASGIPVHSVMNKDHWKYPLSSPDPEVVAKSIKGMETSLRNAQLWGAGVVLLVPAVVTPEVTYQQAWQRSVSQIQKLLPMAEQMKVIIAVEEVWNKFLLSPLEFATYVDSFNSPYLKAYFDVGNVALYGYPQDWIRTLNARIVRLHFKDFSFRPDPGTKKMVADWVNLGDGDLNWQAIYQALLEIGYKNDATVEVSGGNAEYLTNLSWRVDQILEGNGSKGRQ